MAVFQPIQSNLQLFTSFFRGRTDLYARFWQSSDGQRSGFAPVYRLNDKTRPLTDAVIADHLKGGEVIGVYPLLQNNTTNFLAIDFDGDGWLESAGQVVRAAEQQHISCSLERSRSGNGGHVWFFFDQPIAAAKARRFGGKLLAMSGTDRRMFDRMFPSQDAHTGKGFGNLIVVPFHGRYLQSGNTAFIDRAGQTFTDQWAYLRSLNRISELTIDQLIGQTAKPTTPPAEISRTDDDIVVPTSTTSVVIVTVSGRLFIPFSALPAALLTFVKKRLIFSNPEYRKREHLGYSTWDTPRVLKHIKSDDTGIWLPAGILLELVDFCSGHDLKLQLVDDRAEGKQIAVKSSVKLRPAQQKIAKSLLQQDRTVLVAPPGFGKTVVGIDQIRRRKRTTLVIVHTRPLLEQWQKQLQQQLNLSKKDLGMIGANRWKIGKKVTVALYQTLARRGVDSIRDQFGFVIIDECHHVPAHTFTKVLRELPAKFALGLTATITRHDQLDRLIPLYVGQPIEVTTKAKGKEVDNSEDERSGTLSSIPTTVTVRRTTFQVHHRIAQFSEIVDRLIADSARNELIISDVATAILGGAKCLILTERVAHGEELLRLIRQRCHGLHAAVLTGTMTKTERGRKVRRLSHKRFQLLIATGKLIGEGFDWPEATHLFIVSPVSWKGKLIQYIGRVQRAHDTKQAAAIYDYADFDVPMLKVMVYKRLRVYRELGLIHHSPGSLKRTRSVSKGQLALF